MILLDGIDKHDDDRTPKLVAEASSSAVPVARAHTPTPSLPDYEASQAQLRPTTQSYPDIQKKRTRRRRCRKYTIYVLAAYFVLTVVIGVPILVVKMKHRSLVQSNPPYQSWGDNDPVPPKSIQLGDAPLRISAAKSCNAWNVKDRPDGAMFVSELEYHVPVNGSVFLNTNITYATNATYLNQFAGTLLVGVNDDASVPDGVVYVTMHHTSKELAESTNVCLMETGSGGGIYVFAPTDLSLSDGLVFNITLLLPQNNTSSRNIHSLMCHLPHFQHTYQQLDPQITFDNVVFGGAMSGVYVESLQAHSATVKASSAEIRGKFKVSSQISLETVSAPINAEIDLYNDGTAPTFMHLTTGNSILNANITLHAPQMTYIPGQDEDNDAPPPPPGAQFYTHAETFNAPLNVAFTHAADSPVANFRVQAVNNLGNTRVTLDSKYAGTFDVSTMFAQADVLTPDGTGFDDNSDMDGDGDDDAYSNSTSTSSASTSTATVTVNGSVDLSDKVKVRMFLPPAATTTSANVASTSSAVTAQVSGRCLEYDMISPSEIRGWVGIPPRPPTQQFFHRRPYTNQSHVDVISSLNGAQLVLQA